MIKTISLCVLMFAASTAMAQKSGDADKHPGGDSPTKSNVSPAFEVAGNPQVKEDSIYSCTVANRATTPGGMDMFFKHVIDNFVYPKRCWEQGINGSVLIRFVVEKDGRVSNAIAVEQTPKCPEFTAEAIRVINSTPRWIPGTHNGQNVRSYLEIPIRMSVK
jgi:protein TonB